MNEHLWKRAEKDQARRERMRYIRSGRIIPAYGMRPSNLVKVDGSWQRAVGSL